MVQRLPCGAAHGLHNAVPGASEGLRRGRDPSGAGGDRGGKEDGRPAVALGDPGGAVAEERGCGGGGGGRTRGCGQGRWGECRQEEWEGEGSGAAGAEARGRLVAYAEHVSCAVRWREGQNRALSGSSVVMAAVHVAHRLVFVGGVERWSGVRHMYVCNVEKSLYEKHAGKYLTPRRPCIVYRLAPTPSAQIIACPKYTFVHALFSVLFVTLLN